MGTAVAVSTDDQISLRRDTRRCRWSLAGLVLALGLAGCGQDGGNSGETAKPPKEINQSAPGSNVLGRRDAPPEGVKEQINFGGVGDGSCESGLAPPPRITFLRKFFSYQGDYDPTENDEPGRGDQLFICLPGFSETEPIQAEIRRPDGRVSRRQAILPPKLAASTVVWDTLPSDPFGTYRVTARQGSVRVRSTFMLKPPTNPQIRVIGRRHELNGGGPPGTPFTTVLVGLEPRQQVRLDIYRSRQPLDGTFRYVTSIPVTLNERGEAVYTIKTAKGDPSGLYVVMTNVPGLVGESSPVFFNLG